MAVKPGRNTFWSITFPNVGLLYEIHYLIAPNVLRQTFDDIWKFACIILQSISQWLNKTFNAFLELGEGVWIVHW